MEKKVAAAILTIRSAGAMSDKGRKDIAEWLRMQAKALVKYGKEYDTGLNSKFIARYIYKQ